MRLSQARSVLTIRVNLRLRCAMARTTCDDAGLALDMPTLHGKVMGRSLDHFRSEGAKADSVARALPAHG